MLTRTRQVIYTLINLYISYYYCWQIREFCMYCFLFYTSTKTQSLADVFVAYCMHFCTYSSRPTIIALT